LEGIGYAVGAAGIPAASGGAPHIRQRLWFVAESNNSRLAQRERGAELGRQDVPTGQSVAFGTLGDADSTRPAPGRVAAATARYGDSVESDGGDDWRSPSNGFWEPADWIHCMDGKWRPIEPGTFPLAYGVSNRLGRLRAYGNAIVPQVAATFVEAYLSVNMER
jgi:DNA (cytosine-5)-methyltransferase 1